MASSDISCSKFYGDDYVVWISGVLLVIIGVIGLLGNIITMIVLSKPKMEKSVFNNLLLALCSFDTLYILSYGSREAYKIFACIYDYKVYKFISFISVPLSEIGLIGSVYMIVAISLERYLGICHPHLQFYRRSWIFILPVIVITIGCNFPIFLKKEISFVNGTYVVESTGIVPLHPTSEAYYIWARVFYRLIIPLLALVILNGFTFATIYKTTKFHRTTHPNYGTTTMKTLFWIVLIFIVLNSFPMAFWFMLFFRPSTWTTRMFSISALVKMTYCSVNFLIYCLVGSNFREELFMLFRCIVTTPTQPQHNSAELGHQEQHQMNIL